MPAVSVIAGLQLVWAEYGALELATILYNFNGLCRILNKAHEIGDDPVRFGEPCRQGLRMSIRCTLGRAEGEASRRAQPLTFERELPDYDARLEAMPLTSKDCQQGLPARIGSHR
jgi:hypothetical protein